MKDLDEQIYLISVKENKFISINYFIHQLK